MQSVPQPSGNVLVPTSTVRLGSREVEVSTWSVSREISSGLPQRLVAGAGISAATADVVVAPDAVADSTIVSIIDPARRVTCGDLGDVRAGYASTGEAQLLTGRINTVRQGLASNTVTVGLIDDTDRLDRAVSHEALLDVMPPHADFASDRSVGIRPEYIVDYALRRSAWHATPSPRGSVAVHAPMMGSAWPHIGTLLQSGSSVGLSTVGLTTARSAWGYGLEDGRANYRPARTISTSSAIELTVCVDQASHAATAVITLVIGGDEAAIAVAPSSVSARLNGVTVASLGARAGREVITLRMDGRTWTLADDTGAESTGSGSLSGDLSDVRVAAPTGSLIGGVSACAPPPGEVLRPVRAWERTAHIDTGGLHETLVATPDIQDTTVADVLGPISDALLASMWIDEVGHFHWVHPDRLRSGIPAAELTTRENLLNLELTDLLSARVATTSVAGRSPQVSRAAIPTRTVWTGSGDRIPPGQSATYLVGPSGDGAWIGVDPPHLVEYVATYRGSDASFFGGSFPNGDTEEIADTGVTADWSRIGLNTWRLIVNNSTNKSLTQRIPADSGFPQWLEGDNLPLVRAHAQVEWVNEVTASLTAGSGVRDYEHDGAHWVQRESHRRRFADYLASVLAPGIPEVDQVEVIPNYALQLGDHVRLSDRDISNVTIHGVVTGIDMDGKGPDVSMHVRLAVLSVGQYAGLVSSPATGNIAAIDHGHRAETVDTIDTEGGI